VEVNTDANATEQDADTSPAIGGDLTADPNAPGMWRARIDRCIQEKKTHLINDWAENVDYRRGKPFSTVSDSDRVNVNIDWSLTKSKQAQLYSQTPPVYLTPKRPEFKMAVAKFQKNLNDTLTAAKMGTTVNETVIDAINAAGFGASISGYRSTTVMKDMPTIDPATLPPELQSALAQGTYQIPMESTPQVVDKQHYTKRISPADLLWPLEFTGSDFEEADWIGYTGRCYWSEAQREFGLTDEQKARVTSSAGNRDENLRQDDETSLTANEPVITYHEIYYWAIRFDANEKYFKKINRLVFVDGIEAPVKHEAWTGQKFDEASGKYVGSCRRPIVVLTLTYISDDAIPPSDTAIGRPQVKELIRARTQIVEQRERSKPLRWFDVNRVDPMIQDTLMRGTWQGMIPTQGSGDKVVGEIARSNYPREEFDFDRVAKSDLQEQWQTGPNQSGQFASGGRSAREAGIVDQNFQTRVGFERSRVAECIVAIAEIHAGLLALYGDFDYLSDQEIQALEQSWDYTHIANEFVYYIRPDSTILLDSNQRIDKLEKLLNLVGKSGYINPQPIIEELVALHGVDPSTVVIEPTPQEPPPPTISFRFSGDDLLSPIAIAMLLHAKQGPSPEELNAAKDMLRTAFGDNLPPEMSGMVAPHPNNDPGAPPQGSGLPANGDSRPNWTPIPRISKRHEELGG
jgi:hypothetical protein